MKNYNLINQRATTCKHGGHCEWIACDKCSHYEPDVLNQQPCEDCISRQEAINCVTLNEFRYKIVEDIKTLPSVTPKEKIIHCKDCKYRDYWGDCNKWSKELDAHKSYTLDENMFCGFAERK